jgi:opacity protein-like surface antigen
VTREGATLPNRTQILRSRTASKLTSQNWLGFCLRFTIATLCLTSALTAHAQARAAADRQADAQIGGGYSNADSDYSTERYPGYFIYGTFDFTKHFGLDAEYEQVHYTGTGGMYERTYQIGGRYVRHYGRFHPYLRGMYGRGVFNFPFNRANLAYNMLGIGGGVDVNIARHINARVDYEHQTWYKFVGDKLQPSVISVGAAYHF